MNGSDSDHMFQEYYSRRTFFTKNDRISPTTKQVLENEE